MHSFLAKASCHSNDMLYLLFLLVFIILCLSLPHYYILIVCHIIISATNVTNAPHTCFNLYEEKVANISRVSQDG